jgi:ankyrin repeat protein
MKHLLLTTIAAVVLVGCGEAVKDISITEAAESGNIKAAKQHLAAGTDVDAMDKWDRIPLFYAAYKGHKEVAELLIAKGADLNAKDYQVGTPLDYAVALKRTGTAGLLRKHGGKTGEVLKAEGK